MSDFSTTPQTHAVIVAAGSSRRMGFDKLAASVCGHSVLYHSIAAFAECEVVEQIVVVAGKDRWSTIESFGFGEKVVMAEGGKERHFSVANGLEVLPEDGVSLVAVHDGARPMITRKMIEAVVKKAAETGAASLAHPITDTLKRAHDGMIGESVSRDDLWAMETPQVFSRSLLVDSYEHVLSQGLTVTDEVSALQSAGHDVAIVENPEPNLKITFPADLIVAEAIYSTRAKS